MGGDCRSRPLAYEAKTKGPSFSRHPRAGGDPTLGLSSVREVFQPCVYLLASRRLGTLYTGVTSDIVERIRKHREHVHRGFTSRYAIARLVWYEVHERMETAIEREKRIKTWNRDWKIRLIEEANAEWRDLAADFGFQPHRTPTITRHPRAGGDPTDDGAIANRRELDSRLRGNDEDE